MLDRTQSSSVFLSYARQDRQTAERLARALAKNDVSVWWDDATIPLGADFIKFMQDQILSSACVIVLWSERSIQSKYTINEAELALQRGVLLPVIIDNVQVPSQFARIQPATLKDWDGDPNNYEFLRVVEAVQRIIRRAPSSAEETRTFKESQRSAERRAQELFQRNLRSESTIDHFELSRTPFYDELNWNLNSGVNILLGRNGYGKTYLLRSLVALLQYRDDAAINTINDGTGSIALTQGGDERVIHFADHFFDEEVAVGKLPVLAIPDMRFVNRSVTTLGAISDETTGKGDRADLASYGAWHFLEERPYEGMIHGFLYGLCLDYFERQVQFEGEQFDLLRDVVRELTDRSFEFDRVAREGRDRFTLYVRTEGNEATPLPIQKASQGTLSVVSMFGLIYEFLQSLRQEAESEVCKRSGIILIDEVDAHLHPMWQQKIVGMLRNRFPRAQFIITAHNPIAIAGCLQDEVSVLRKNSDRGFTLYQFPNDFVGWQVEDIYRKVFGVENPDDTFTRYDAMRPFKTQLEQQAAGLASQLTRDPAEDRSLTEIEEKILYIEKAEQVRSHRLTQEELERENRTLRDRLLGLETAHQSVAENQHELDRVSAQMRQESENRDRDSRRARILALAIWIILATGLTIHLRSVPKGLGNAVPVTIILAMLLLTLLARFVGRAR